MKAEAILTLRTNILLLRTAPPCLAHYESFESRENRVRESELIKLVFDSHKLEKEISVNVLDGVQPKPTSTRYLVCVRIEARRIPNGIAYIKDPRAPRM